jgi:hypothetical protein
VGGFCCLLICLFGPSARCLPERKVLQTEEGKRSVLLGRSSLSFYEKPSIPILQNKFKSVPVPVPLSPT